MKSFCIKNFERFQHYKDRSPPWIKLYNELLDDYEFARLQDASKLHLILIWLLASRSDNKLPYDPTWIAKRINATAKVDLDVLLDAGFIIVDQRVHNVEQHASNTLAHCQQDARPEREGETEVEKINISIKSDWPEDFRERFWFTYPRKVGKKATIAKLEVVKRSGEVRFEVLLKAVRSIEATDEKFIPHPLTWLNQGRYLDGGQAVVAISTGPPEPPSPDLPTDEQLRAKYHAERRNPETDAAEGEGVLDGGVGICDEKPNGLGASLRRF